MKEKFIICLILFSLLLCSCSRNTGTSEATVQQTTQEQSDMGPIEPFYSIKVVKDNSIPIEDRIVTSTMLEDRAKIEIFLDVKKMSNINYLTFEYTQNYEGSDKEDALIISEKTEKIEIRSDDFDNDKHLAKKIASFYLEKPACNDEKEEFNGFVDVAVTAYNEEGVIISRIDDMKTYHYPIQYFLIDGELQYMMTGR